MSLVIKSPGMLSLIQDAGRFGYHNIGLTTGGPLDSEAFYWANRLLDNPTHAAMIELTVGGLTLQAQKDTVIAVTGAEVEVKLDGEAVCQWQGVAVACGQTIEFGFAQKGCRIYMAVAGGLAIRQSFGSVSTVVREGIGGLNGNKLAAEDILPIHDVAAPKLCSLAKADRPNYPTSVELRVVLGYQHDQFSDLQKAIFFSRPYKVTAHYDRMGYRLEGDSIAPAIDGILSEGICQGAIQVPADGQPIVLINDRQTIGGYPKIGSVIGLDIFKLTQLMAGGEVRFTPISIEQAHNEIHLALHRRQTVMLTDL